MEFYERNLNMQIKKISKEEIYVRGSMLDLDHNILIELKVEVKTKKIIYAKAEMIKSPFKKCNFALKRISLIKGLKVERGISKEIYKRLGTEEGCIHLVEICMSILRLTANFLLALEYKRDELKKKGISEEELMKIEKKFLKGTCVVFKD